MNKYQASNQPLEEKQQPDSASDSQAIEHQVTDRQTLLVEIGAKLLQARESKGKNIDTAVRKLRIHQHHLLALEQGRDDALPDDAYVIGFLRQYSQYLNIDLSDEIKRLKNSQYTLTKPLTFPDPPIAPSRQWAWLSGGLFVILFILFNIINSDHKYENVNVDGPASHNEFSNDNMASNTVNESISSVPDSSASDSSTTESLAAHTYSPSTNTAKHKASGSTALAAAGQQNISPLQIQTPAVKLSAASPNQSQAVEHLYRFEAVTSPIWLQVSLPNERGDGKGRLLKEVLLQQGYHSNIRQTATALWITCGNAPSLRIKVDGKIIAATGSLGSGKKVLRDYRFSIAKP